MSIRRVFVFTVCLLALRMGTAVGENIALKKPYVLKPRPSYPHCTDPGDARQLTDGKRLGAYWTQKTTVGWGRFETVFITIDLGKDHRIGGLSFSSAAGTAGVHWPAELLVFVSDDGKKWFQVGDLVKLSARKKAPPKKGYANHVFRTDGLDAYGRFVQVVAVPTEAYIFVDEVEVFSSDDSLPRKPRTGRGIDDLADFMSPQKRVFDKLIKAQLRRDLDAVRHDVKESTLTAKVDEAARAIEKMPKVSPKGFRAVLPMTDLERDIFRLQAEVWRAQGKAPLRAWKTHRWDPLAPSQEPSGPDAPPLLDVRMMNNEHRADVLNLTNSRGTDAEVLFRLEGLPGGVNPDYVTVYEVLIVGTRHSAAVSAPLSPARRKGQDYALTVPAGMTRQVWFSFNPRKLEPGTHKGRISVLSSDAKLSVPVHLEISPVRFPDSTTLQLGGWSYTNQKSIYGITPRNRDLLVAHLREHCVNAPWATSAAMPSGTYDASGSLTRNPDTRNFDSWVKRWPGATRYMVFLAVGGTFAGSKMGTARFEKKVAAWIHFWATHMKGIGLKAQQLGLLLIDEPQRREQYETIIAWANVIQKAEPEVVIWEDPGFWEAPRSSKLARAGLQMVAHTDVLCVPRRSLLDAKSWYHKLVRDQKKQGRELWLYSCQGPARSFDPYSYYLLQAWHCFGIGAKGSSFWAFGDTGTFADGGSVWNEYLANGKGPFCPVYLEKSALTSAKYMEAIREGAQDYEYLVMLRDRIRECEKAGKAGVLLSRAKKLLESACERVHRLEQGTVYEWDVEKDRTAVDIVRYEVLQILTELSR